MSAEAPRSVRLFAILATTMLVALGVWAAGALVTDDAGLAKVLTAGWFVLLAVIALGVAVKWHSLALPVVTTYVVVATVLGGFLLYTSTVDQVVDEQVVTASSPADQDNGGTPTGPGRNGADAINTEVAAGRFVGQAHPTGGRAALIVS